MVRSSNPSPKMPLSENITLLSIAKGLLIAYVITIPVFLLFALILSNTDFPEKYVSTAVIIITIISILTAGSTSTKGLKNKGWMNGGLVGLIYMLVLYLVSSVIYNNFTIDKYVITMTVIGVLTGAIGGIMGINFKKSGRRYLKG